MKLTDAEKLISDTRSLETERASLRRTIRPLEIRLMRNIRETWRLKGMDSLSSEEAFELYLKSGGIDPDVIEAARDLRDAHKKDGELFDRIKKGRNALTSWIESVREKRIRELKSALENLAEPARKAVSHLARDAQEAEAVVSQLRTLKDLRHRVRMLTNVTADPAIHADAVYSASVVLYDLKSGI